MSDACIKVVAPNGVEPDSWLNGPDYAPFRAAYVYATGQSAAIPALSTLTAEDVFHLYEALKRGEENFKRRKAEEARHAQEDHEADALEMIGMVWREVEPRADGRRRTITLTERIPYWGFHATELLDGPWALTEWALVDYYEPELATCGEGAQ